MGMVRTNQAVQLVFIAAGGCRPEGAAALDVAVQGYLVAQRASLRGSTSTCIEDTTARAAGADHGAEVGAAAVGVRGWFFG
jgi:hypothetical protein